MHPPSLCYCDYLIENIRTSSYTGIERFSKAGKYLFESEKKDKNDEYTDEDLIPLLEIERSKTRHQRHSIKGYWINLQMKIYKDKLYTEPLGGGNHVYNEQEKGPQSLYGYYKPTGTIEEQRMEQYWLNKQNKEIAEKRETEEFVHFMKDWSSAKQRYETELIRKNGQGFSGSNFEKRAFRLTSKVTIQK